MEIEKECMLCSKQLASQQCRVCGRVVCEAHYAVSKGCCTECAAGKVAA